MQTAVRHAPQRSAVELIERAGSRAQTFADPLDAAQTQGYGHWALEVDDLDAAFALPSAAPGPAGVVTGARRGTRRPLRIPNCPVMFCWRRPEVRTS